MIIGIIFVITIIIFRNKYFMLVIYRLKEAPNMDLNLKGLWVDLDKLLAIASHNYNLMGTAGTLCCVPSFSFWF